MGHNSNSLEKTLDLTHNQQWKGEAEIVQASWPEKSL